VLLLMLLIVGRDWRLMTRRTVAVVTDPLSAVAD